MKYSARQIVFREIPEEVSLAYQVNGCQLRCHGCHSADTWSDRTGFELDSRQLARDLQRYEGLITCVVFLGGEWHHDELVALLQQVRRAGLKTALYTGQEDVSQEIFDRLDFIKTGPYLQDRGGLESLHTNQRLYDLRSGKTLNSYFQHQEEDKNDSTYR